MRRVLAFALIAIMVGGAALIGSTTTSSSGTVVVSPANMNGWGFFQEGPTATGAMVVGPLVPPAGIGSARMTLDATGREILATAAHAGTPFADIDSLEYSTYQNPASGASAILAISLQFDADYDLTDANTAFQGRLVFEPYYTNSVVQGAWQTWDPLAGVWWATGAPGNASCPISSPCTWATVLSTFPNAGVRATVGGTYFKAGGPWPNFDGNVDEFTIDINGDATTFDFEPPPPPCALDCYVRPDGNDANPGTADTPLLAKKTIQAAVNTVTPGGTVHVANGTYDENVTVPNAMTIVGESEAGVIVRPALSGPNCTSGGGSICPGGSNVFLIQASDVTIHQLTVDGDNTTLTSGVVAGGADLDARNGIITDHTTGVFQNLEIFDTTVKNIYLRGIYASSGGSFDFHDDTVQNVQGEAASIAMFNFGGAGTFANNVVSDANDAIASNWSTGSTYTGNVVTTSGSGVHSDNNGGFGGVADVLDGNSVSNCTPGGFGVWTFAPFVGPTVSENTVTNCAVGLAASGRNDPVPVVTSFVDNTVDGQNLAGSTGVYVTTDRFGFGSTDVHATLTGNIVKNNTDGFLIEAQPGFTANVDANFNDISGNGTSGATRSGGGAFSNEMTANWWGSDTGPAHALNPGATGNAVSDDITYSPWLGIGTDASGAAGFQLASPMTWVAGPDVCGATCIQAGIDYSSDGDTIKARTGLYSEFVVVDKDVTLTQASSPVIDGGGSGDVVTVTASGATVNGFEIRNGTNGVVVTSGANNVTITANTIHTFTSAGLRATSASGADYSTNTITGPHTGSCIGGFWGMLLQNVSGTINDNTISGIGNGITNGCQEGRAIEATGAGSLDITNNDVSQYQKSGIIVRDTLATNITGNTTAGEGPSGIIAQNGITVTSTGATLIDNNDTSGHRYTPEDTQSCGILTFNTVTITNNDSFEDETGICAIGGTGSLVNGNDVIKHTQQGILVDGAVNISVGPNLVDGQGNGTTASPGTDPDTDTRYYGIFVVDSTGTLMGNTIKGITHGVANGTQSGVGIRVTARSGAASDIEIDGNNITDVQKNAMVITNTYGGTSVDADVHDNTVAGNGPVSYIAQNGIQVSGGANATVDNNDVSGYDYTPNSAAAVGILIIGAGTVSVTNNDVHDLMEGMFIQQTNGAQVTLNDVVNARDTGIFVLLSDGVTVDQNSVGTSGNAIYLADASSNTVDANIVNANTNGVVVDGASDSNTIQNNIITSNTLGVDVEPFGPSPTNTEVHGNCIAGNTSFGMRVHTDVGVVDAENNWWGKVNGPNPPGFGDALDSAATIDAIPFLTAPSPAGCPIPADGDGDGIDDPDDNCPTVHNTDQKNTNGEVIFLPKPTPFWNDRTNPAHDNEGDACDPDIDGDSVLNGAETSAGLSPFVWDTDGDRTNDGTEITCGTDPLSAPSNLSGPDTDNDRLPDACEPAYGTNPADPDSDADAVRDGVEVRYWMSNPLVVNTDGDNCKDSREVATVNNDRVVNSTDLGILASSFGALTPEFRPYDMDGNGVINSADLGYAASQFSYCL